MRFLGIALHQLEALGLPPGVPALFTGESDRQQPPSHTMPTDHSLLCTVRPTMLPSVRKVHTDP
jgi:hypothetical protein